MLENSPHWSTRWRSPRAWLVVLVGYWLLLFVATHWPNDLPIVGGGQIDKVVHFAAYGLLAFILASTTHLRGLRLTLRAMVLLWIVVVLYGAADELLQPPVGRNCDIYDWIADAVGAAVGLLAYRWFFAEKIAPAS